MTASQPEPPAARSPRDHGWSGTLLALFAFTLLPPLLVHLRAVLPVEETVILLVPAVAVCFIVGWWAGGRLSLALLWSGFSVWLLTRPAPDGMESYLDLARAWSLIAAGAFGVVCIAGVRRRPFERALTATGLALLLAAMIFSLSAKQLARPRKVFEEQLVRRDAASEQWLTRMIDRSARVPALGALASRPVVRELAERLTRQLYAGSSLAAGLFPALLALEALAALTLAWALYHRLSRTRIGPPLAPLREFRFNDQLVWGLVVGMVMVLLPTLAPVAALGKNLLLFFGLLYALRGLGVLAWVASRRGRPATTVGAAGALLTGLLFGLVGWEVTAVAAGCVGLADTWLDWRRRSLPAER